MSNPQLDRGKTLCNYVTITHQQQDASECQAKHQWSSHVRVLKYLLVCPAQRIKHGQSLQMEMERERRKQCKLIGLKL